MNEDYLWDRSGEPDAEIVRLEQSLGELRWSERQRDFAVTVCTSWWTQQSAWWLAAAALLVLCTGTAIAVKRMQSRGPVTSWQLSVAGGKPSAVRRGQVIETGDVIHGTLQSEFVGTVDIEPGSKLRVLTAREHEQRLALDHGTIHALIWAPPARFVVDTPSAKTVDLGCQYTLHVARDGTGFLTVRMGWVAFEWRSIESFIPAGAACRTRPGHGPDTPYFLDAPETLTKAIAQFDVTGSRESLDTAVSAARPRDALTLWHLLQRTHENERAEVFDRFSELVDLPGDVSRKGILRGDDKAMDAAWDALHLGNTNWWRTWKRQW